MIYEVYDIDSLGYAVEVTDIRTYARKTRCEILKYIHV